MGEGDRQSDESSHFRLVPVGPNGDKFGTRSTATTENVNAGSHNSWGIGGTGGFLRCPKETRFKLEDRGEINVTQTVDIRK